MFYKKFETDEDDCVKVQIFSLASDSKEFLISQLITDGNVDDKNVIISKKNIDDIKFDYLDKNVIEEIKQYQNDCTFGIVKEVKVEHPSYCMFTVYRYNGKDWSLLGRTIISNKKNKLLYDFRMVENIPYLESEYILDSKPDDLLSNQKVLKRKNNGSRNFGVK